MTARKFTHPLGSFNKKPGLREEVQESQDHETQEEYSKEQMGVNTEYDRRRGRVALRTGSPKAPTRISLRTIKLQASQTPLTVRGESRSPGCTTKIGLGSRSSAQSKSANASERKPWGAPTVRSPACHGQSISKRKRTYFELPASEEISISERPRHPPRQYSLRALLALRPASTQDRRRYAVLSYSEDSEFEMSHENRALSSQNGASSQHQERNLPVLPTLKLPACDRESSLHEKSLEWSSDPAKQHGLFSTVRTEDLPQPSPLTYRGQHRINAPRGTTVKGYTEDQAASVEDLESRIRSALSNRGRRNFEALAKPRSVRWDPSILAVSGPRNRLITSETSEVVGDITKTSQEACFRQETKAPETTSAQGGCITAEKNPNKKFSKYMKSIAELKKGDRNRLLQLLEALKNLDSDDSSDTDTEAERARRKAKGSENIRQKSKLNPTAAAFQDLSPLHAANSPIKPALRVPRQVFVLPNKNHNPHEPPWVKRGPSVPEAERFGVKGHQKENAPLLRADIFQSYPRMKDRANRANQTIDIPGATKLLRCPFFLPPVNVNSCPVPSISVPPKGIKNRLSTSTAHSQDNTRVNPRLPIIDLATGRIPKDDEHGREAHVVPWGNLILEGFQKRYPRTGNLRAAPPAPIKNTHAASIQQRLEYLLMEQKERQARGEALNERCKNNQAPKQANLLYQAEKDATRRLKADIRRDELERKIVEHSVLTTEPKMRVRMVLSEERISESSTVVDSIYSTNGVNTGREGGGETWD